MGLLVVWLGDLAFVMFVAVFSCLWCGVIVGCGFVGVMGWMVVWQGIRLMLCFGYGFMVGY